MNEEEARVRAAAVLMAREQARGGDNGVRDYTGYDDAHELEDALLEDALRAIADGATEARAIATIVCELWAPADRVRWYA